MGSPLPELISRARALSAERDRLEEAIACRWVAALKGQPVSPQDLEELWTGLAEEAVRGLLKSGQCRWAPESVRQEVAEVIARVRARVERALTGTGNGQALNA